MILTTNNNYCSVYLLKNSHFVNEIEDQDFEEYFILKHSALYLNRLKGLHL